MQRFSGVCCWIGFTTALPLGNRHPKRRRMDDSSIPHNHCRHISSFHTDERCRWKKSLKNIPNHRWMVRSTSPSRHFEHRYSHRYYPGLGEYCTSHKRDCLTAWVPYCRLQNHLSSRFHRRWPCWRLFQPPTKSGRTILYRCYLFLSLYLPADQDPILKRDMQLFRFKSSDNRLNFESLN